MEYLGDEVTAAAAPGELDQLFRDAAWSLKSSGWQFSVDDLVQDLWVWYLENPGLHHKFENVSEWPKAIAYVKKVAYALARGGEWEQDKFRANFDYSVDTAKAVLRGEVAGPLAVQDRAAAFESLDNEQYREVLVRRYERGEFMRSDSDKGVLKRAHAAFANELNWAAAKRKREDGIEDVPGKSLGDGLCRPKPKPAREGSHQPEPEPVRGYYARRKYDERY